MRQQVTVKTNAKQQRIELLADGHLKVWLKSQPIGGKANAELVALLAEWFGVNQSKVTLKLGRSAKKKLVEIDDT